ncbi:hypothetical protein H7C19_06800 [Cohnella nanjingensis]|uniref:Uncharacterized protein n=1 Tax=Cohnella nanjingensis TaxID=1387779 RepID=A0A7X0RN84_9BACL|nr:hypothetical protein [Cohnella nanjingensis]
MREGGTGDLAVARSVGRLARVLDLGDVPPGVRLRAVQVAESRRRGPARRWTAIGLLAILLIALKKFGISIVAAVAGVWRWLRGKPKAQPPAEQLVPPIQGEVRD